MYRFASISAASSSAGDCDTVRGRADLWNLWNILGIGSRTQLGITQLDAHVGFIRAGTL